MIPVVNDAMARTDSTTLPPRSATAAITGFANSATPICANPKNTVSTRPSVNKRCGDGFDSTGTIRSFVAEAADELSELDKVDIAAANTAASINPHRPNGMSSTMNVANALSDSVKDRSGGKCAKYAANPKPINMNSANWSKTMMPLSTSERPASASLRADSRR